MTLTIDTEMPTAAHAPFGVSTARLNWLRAAYLFMAAGISIQFAPQLFAAAGLPPMQGVVIAMLSALALLSALGVFSPLRMLPVLLFEIAWKLLWTMFVAMPHVLAGTLDQSLGETLFAVAFAIPFVIIVPWRYVARTFLGQAERWR